MVKQKSECMCVCVFVQLPGITDHPGPATCPRIENNVDSSVILISSGKVEAISVKPVNLKVRCAVVYGGRGTDRWTDGRTEHLISCYWCCVVRWSSAEEGYVFGRVCLFVCLFVGLLGKL